MIVGEGGADGHIDFESAAGGVKEELWGGEGVVVMQLQQPVVEPTLVLSIESIDHEMEIEHSVPFHQGVGNRVFTQLLLLFLQSSQLYGGIGLHGVYVDKLLLFMTCAKHCYT